MSNGYELNRASVLTWLGVRVRSAAGISSEAAGLVSAASSTLLRDTAASIARAVASREGGARLFRDLRGARVSGALYVLTSRQDHGPREREMEQAAASPNLLPCCTQSDDIRSSITHTRAIPVRACGAKSRQSSARLGPQSLKRLIDGADVKGRTAPRGQLVAPCNKLVPADLSMGIYFR